MQNLSCEESNNKNNFTLKISKKKIIKWNFIKVDQFIIHLNLKLELYNLRKLYSYNIISKWKLETF